MTESSPISTTAEGHLQLACPDWCIDTNHPDDDLQIAWTSENGLRITCGHSGPRFGAFYCGGEVVALTGDTYPDVSIDTTAVVMDTLGGREKVDDSAGLRQLAADALAAAEWLEAQR